MNVKKRKIKKRVQKMKCKKNQTDIVLPKIHRYSGLENLNYAPKTVRGIKKMAKKQKNREKDKDKIFISVAKSTFLISSGNTLFSMRVRRCFKSRKFISKQKKW